MTATSCPEDPLIGRVVGRYRLERRIARGGQSSVYEGRVNGTRVAVKLLHGEQESSALAVGRMRREVEAIRRLRHPNVVQVLDSGETGDGRPWLAMEYLEGESLAALLERVGPLTAETVIALLTPICAALEQAHRTGIVHRDLKPQNILLADENGQRVPKLVDFGIAALKDAETLTNSAIVSGTPMYMAPEQWDGLSHADARSDVYSLGMIVYHALSGRYAYAADSPLAWMKQVQLDPPLDLAVAAGERRIPPAVCAGVMRALTKDPSARPQTPLEFLRGLGPVERTEPSASSASRARARRLAVAGALLLGGGLVGFYLRPPAARTPGVPAGPPSVVLMDTPVPHGVYDPEVLAHGGTNADALDELLRDLPISIEKETLPGTWSREAHVLELRPALIVVHRSAFFHGLNLEFGFGYEPFADEQTKARWALLYRTAEDKLLAFMGLVGTSDSRTKFLVYSRGTGASGSAQGWPDPGYRAEWVASVERRFPALKGRVATLAIEGGVEKGSFKNPVVIRQVRGSVLQTLGLAPR